MHTILGAGGAIGRELVRVLAQRQLPVRLVGRHVKLDSGAVETVAADVTILNQTTAAVAGSKVVYLLVGLPYASRIWAETWPKLMYNTIEACKQAGAKLVFFDNVYLYGKVDGAMTEDTPINPCSRKGETRARVATKLLNEVQAGKIEALIARSADFYGPSVRTSIFNILVANRLAKSTAAAWLVNDAVPHSFTFTPDAARALAILAGSDSAWGQTWHLPTAANPPTGRQWVEMAAKAMGAAPQHRVFSRPLLKLVGLFNTDIRESYEMLYQYDSAYLFDSTKFVRTFDVDATGYPEGVSRTVGAIRQSVTAAGGAG